MSYPYGTPSGGFPPQQPYPGQPNYPPQPGFNYPPQPGASGYSPNPFQPAPGYPAQPGYPPQQGGYPPQQGGYPPQQGGYPPQQPGGYPPQQPGGYPPQQPGGYAPPPQQQGGYAPPPQQQGGYAPPPQQQPHGYGNYPPPQGAAPYYPPQQGGYQPQQQASYQPTGAAPSGYANQVPVMGSSPPMQQGTVRSFPNFSAEDDAKILRKAMKGFGTDEKAIIDVLAARSNTQRQEIKNRFKTMFGKDLLSDLKSELTGHFEGAVLALMMTPAEFDADQLRNAMQGAGTNEGTVTEILCSRNNRAIHEIRAAYKMKFSRDLEKDLMSETSGCFRRLCVSLMQGNRVEGAPVNMDKAKRDAQELYQAGEKMVGTDESKFNQILCSDSFEQLRLVFREYQQISSRSIEQSIKREMSGDVEKGFVSIVKCVENLPGYFATKLYNSMKGWGTKDENLVRVIISRCEVDMIQIKQEFQKQFGKTLESMLEGDLSGDYKHLMIALVRG